MMKNKKKIVMITIVLILILGIVRIVTLEENTVKSTVKGTIDNFDASTTITKTINGIKYQINPNDNSATVLQIAAFDNATCSFNPQGSKDINKATFCINIPESVEYSTNNVTTKRAMVKSIGDGSNGIFGENIIAFLNNMNVEQLVVIFNKSVAEVRNAAISGYGTSKIGNLRLVALSNNIEFKTGSIHTKANLPVKVVAVPGTKTDAVKSVSGVSVVSLYNVIKNTANKTVTIKGFNPGEVFQDTCDANSQWISNKNAVLVNIKFPETMTIDGTEYFVTGIDQGAFESNSRLKNIWIPSTIDTLGEKCFAQCGSVENIYFLSKNASIPSNLFMGEKVGCVYGLAGSTAETFYNNVMKATGAKWGEVKVKSISVRKMPTKVTYQQGETLATAGLQLNAVFETTTGVTAGGIITKGYTVTPTVLNTAGKQTITVNYEGAKTTFVVDVEGSQKVELLEKVTLYPVTSIGRPEVYLGSDYNLYWDSNCTSMLTATANPIGSLPKREGKMAKGYVIVDYSEEIVWFDEEGYINEDINISEVLRTLHKSGSSIAFEADYEDMKWYEVQLSPAAESRDKIYLGKDYNLYLDVDCKLKMTETENNITIPHKEGFIFNGYGIGENGNVLIDENGYAVSEASSILKQMRRISKF